MSMSGESIPQGEIPEIRTILEIGAGRLGPADAINDKSLWQSVPEHRTFDDTERYIGIDLGAKTIVPRPRREAGMTEADVNRKWKAEIAFHDRNMYANWTRVQNKHSGANITFLHADGTSLPLPSESADEIIASNVFGRGVDEEVLPDIYSEAMRVLKPTGKLIIHDSLSPEFIGPNSLSHWMRDNNLPGPSSTTWLNFSTSYYAYTETARKHGLHYDKPRNDSPEELERIKHQNRMSTIWILGKAAAAQPVEASATAPELECEQPRAELVEPDTPERAYQRWKAAFGGLFKDEER